jgi:SOS-response transcriptional repressor LexA
MKNTKRKPLEPWQLEDAARLRALFGARAKMSQEKFGQTYSIGTQGAVWQYLEGRIPLNIAVALKFAEGLGCKVDEISPTLASQIARMMPARDSAIREYEIVPLHRVKVPLLTWQAAAGWPRNREAVTTGEESGGWVSTSASVGGDAFALRVVGDANEPKIQDGSLVVIDPERKPRHGSLVLVKRPGDDDVILRQLWYDGAVAKLRPINPRYPILDMPADTRIIGVAVRAELDLE